MTIATEDAIANRINRVLAERVITSALEPGSNLRQGRRRIRNESFAVREAFRRLEARRVLLLAEFQEVARMRSVLEALALRHAAPHLNHI